METTLIIMAAGMGSRYGGLKQLDPLGPNGETLMEYALFDAARAGFTKVVFVIRREFEDEFRDKIEPFIPTTLQAYYAYQELTALPPGFQVPKGREKPWGTAQAVLTAKPYINEPFAVQNADDFMELKPSNAIPLFRHLMIMNAAWLDIAYEIHFLLTDRFHAEFARPMKKIT